MQKLDSIKKFIAISSLSIFLSMLTVLLGAPFLRVLRKVYGSTPYWALGFVVTGSAWLLNSQPLAIFLGAIWMTLGAYSELEAKGVEWWISGALSTAMGFLVAALGVTQACLKNGISNYADVLKLVDQFVQRISEMNPTVKIETEVLAQQIPSAAMVLLLMAIGLGLIFERRVFSWLNLPREKIASQLKLLEYRVPDYYIWIAMNAFLLTMVGIGGKATAIIAINIVNVSIVLYFFQGLAVLEVFLNSMRAGVFTRVLTYIILVGQMMVVLSIIGLIDYWVDFRRRIYRIMIAGNN